MTHPAVPEVHHVHRARLTAGFDRYTHLDLRSHLNVHGDLRYLDIAGLIDLAERIQLCGRGGAAFPFHRKVRAVVESARRRGSGTVVVVNATEGEPASWKDKVLLPGRPI